MSQKGKSASLKVPFGIQNPSNFVPKENPDEAFYKTCNNEKTAHQIVKIAFSPEQFIRWWKIYEHKPPFRRGMRIMVQIGTIHACLGGRYYLPDNTPVTINKKLLISAALSTRMYQSDVKFNPVSKGYKTKISVVSGDCLEVALHLKNKFGLNPATLIMASRSHPGGGYESGAAAQEENLHRRTNLFQCLSDPYKIDANRKWTYPLPEFGGVYVKNAVVIRRSEECGYAFLTRPEQISFVAVSAYSNPATETNTSGETIISKKLAQHFKQKMSGILGIAFENGHDCIVLSAFGCGAYGNPPKHVARLFKEVIDGPFRGCFKHISFAIYDDVNAFKEHNPEGNVLPFAEVFQTEAIDLEDFLSKENLD